MPKDRQPLNPWSRRPEEMTYEDRIGIVRAPSRGTLKMIVLSHDLIGRGTHHYGQRQFPCRPNCPACKDGMMPQWHGWLAVSILPQEQTALFEMTKTNAHLLDQQFREHRTMRGLMIAVWRPSGTNNGRVSMRIAGKSEQHLLLPQPFDVLKVLYKIWGMRPEDDVPFLPGPSPLNSEAEIDEVARGLERSNDSDRPVGNERSRRRGRADDLRKQSEEDRGIPQKPATDAADIDSIDATQPLQNGSNLVEELANKLTQGLAESSEPSARVRNRIQSICDGPSNGQMGIH